jgi:hypothetical protein
MEAGCHVLSEIPGAYTQEECVRLRAAVEGTGQTYMLAENTCYWDFFRYFRKWIAEDRFGPISIAEGEYVHYIPNTLSLPDGTRLTPATAQAQGRPTSRPLARRPATIQYLTHDWPLSTRRPLRLGVLSQAPGAARMLPLRADGQIAPFETAKGALIKIMVTLNTRRPAEHRYRIFGGRGAEWFSYERSCRRFTRDGEHSGWETVPTPAPA